MTSTKEIITERYLDADLKEYYMKDFNKLLRYNDCRKLDEGTREILAKINDRTWIQTLYSKKGDSINGDQWESYLEFTYVKNAESKIKNILSNLVNSYKDIEGKCFYDFNLPKNNPNYFEELNEELLIGWKNNLNYFRINHIRLTLNLDVNAPNKHIEFWNDLEKYFAVDDND